MSTMGITFQIITLIFILIKSTICSVVQNSMTQDTIYVSQYCPKQKYCRDGTHVMCMYYSHNQEFGSRCGKPVKTVISSKMVETILENVNEIRGRIASGKETGKDNELLPKAYGMMKIEWDRELATLAQVLANQCLGGREDTCRATDRFPNPSQSIAIVHFKYPNWEYIKKNNSEKGLNEEKLTFAMVRYIKSAQALKKILTKEIVTDCPSLQELPDINLKYYLNLIRGGATHIGCGVSAYSKYKIDGKKESIQNSVQVVCNISDGPQTSQPLYNTNPPIPGEGLSKRCGCPRGYRETRSCLCESIPENMWRYTIAATTPADNQPTFASRNVKGSDPMIKLPSFRPSVEWTREQHKSQLEEDVKPESSKSEEKQTRSDENNLEVNMVAEPMFSIKNTPSDKSNNHKINWNKSSHGLYTSHTEHSRKNSGENYSREDRVKQMEYSEEAYQISKALKPKKKNEKSRFSHHPKILKPHHHGHQQESKNTITAVTVVEDMLYNIEEEAITEKALNKAEKNYDENYQYSKPNNYVSNEENKDSDNKHLLSLLNMLEQEVKNTEFDDNLKQSFDLKMNKIYEIMVNKNQEIPPLRRTPVTHLDDINHNLKELKYYLNNKRNTNNEDGISKNERKDNKRTYNENKINQNQNNENQKFDESTETKYVNNMDNPNENSRTNYKLDKYDGLDGKANLDRQYDENDDLPEGIVTRNQETLVPDIVRKPVPVKVNDYKNIDKYNEKKTEIGPSDVNEMIYTQKQTDRNNRRIINGIESYLDKNRDVTSAKRKSPFPESNAQFSTFRQMYNNGEMRPMRLLRPYVEDMSTRSRNPAQRQPMYHTEREILSY